MTAQVFSSLLLVFVSFACVSRKDPAPPSSTRADAEVFTRWQGDRKLPADRIKGSLEVEEYTVGKAKGLLLAANVSDGADYIVYAACPEASGKDAKAPACVTGSTAAMGELLFNLDAGNYYVTYQACVLAERAQGEACGPKTTKRVTIGAGGDEATKKLLQTIHQTSQAIKREALALRKELEAYKSKRQGKTANGDTDKLDALVDNQLAMSPYKLAALYDSSFYDATRQTAEQQVKEAVAQTDEDHPLKLAYNEALAASGSVLMTFGVVGMAAGYWGLYAHKQMKALQKAKRGVRDAGGWIKAGFMDVVNELRPNARPSLEADLQADLKAGAKEFKEGYYQFMGETKNFASKPSYELVAIASTVAVVAGVVLFLLATQKLAESQDAPSALLKKVAAIEGRINKLRAQQGAAITSLAATVGIP